MKHILSAFVVLSLVLTSACSHTEPTLADELSQENLGQAELGNTAPAQETVSSESVVGQPAVVPSWEAPAAPVKSHTKKFAKKKKRGAKKLLAKAKKRSRRNRHR